MYLAGKPTPAAPAQARIRNLPKSLSSSPEEKVLCQKAGEVEGRPTKPKTDGSGGGDPLSRERFPTPPGSFLLPCREEVGRASESLGAKDPSLPLHPPPPAPPTPSQTEAFTFSYCFIAESERGGRAKPTPLPISGQNRAEMKRENTHNTGWAKTCTLGPPNQCCPDSPILGDPSGTGVGSVKPEYIRLLRTSQAPIGDLKSLETSLD